MQREIPEEVREEVAVKVPGKVERRELVAAAGPYPFLQCRRREMERRHPLFAVHGTSRQLFHLARWSHPRSTYGLTQSGHPAADPDLLRLVDGIVHSGAVVQLQPRSLPTATLSITVPWRSTHVGPWPAASIRLACNFPTARGVRSSKTA